MEFKLAKLDTMATIITIITTVFLVALTIFFLVKTESFGWIFSLMMISILVISYLLSPKRYYIQGGNFVIEKVIGRKIIVPLNEIEGIFEVEDFNKLKPVRSMGNGGLFGYYGIFTTKDHGNINCQLTRLKNIIIIKSKSGYFAVSPEKPGLLIDWLKSNTATSIIKQADNEEPITEKATPFILLIPDTILTLSIIMVALLYQRLPDRIATHFDFQGNPNGWNPKISFIYFSILPQIVLFSINIIIFFLTRKRYREPRVLYLLVCIISLIQLFIAYTSFDIYWFNTHNAHLIPIHYLFIVLTMLLLVLFYFYNRMLTKTKKII